MRQDARVSTLLAAAVLAFSTACSDSDDEMFVARLSPMNEVPPVGTGATGTAGFTLQGNTVHYSISAGGISQVLGAHIHAGAAGTNGSIWVVLFPGPGQPPFTDPTGELDGYLIGGSFTASDLTQGSFEELLSRMRSGNAYVNVHTTAFRGGEIRGQIEAVP